MDDGIQFILQSLKNQLQEKSSQESKSPLKLKLTVRYQSQSGAEFKFRIVVSQNEKVKDVAHRLSGEIGAIENHSKLILRLFVKTEDECIQMLQDDFVHDVIDIGEKEHEKVLVKIEKRAKVKEFRETGVQTAESRVIENSSLPFSSSNSACSSALLEDYNDGFKIEPVDIESCVGGNLAQIIRLPPRDDSEPLLPLTSQKDSNTETQKQPKYTNVNMEVFQDGQWLPAQIIDPPAGKTADSDKHVFVTFFTSNEKDQWVDFNKVRFLPTGPNKTYWSQFRKEIPDLIDRESAPPLAKQPRLAPSENDSTNQIAQSPSNQIPVFSERGTPIEERRYKCRFCQKGFKRREHLINHERIHTGEKPYKCELCDAAFGDPSNWRKHKKKHQFEMNPNLAITGNFMEVSGLSLVSSNLSDSPSLNMRESRASSDGGNDIQIIEAGDS